MAAGRAMVTDWLRRWRPGGTALVQQVRWLFLLFLGLVVATGLARIVDASQLSGGAKAVAATAVAAVLAWGIYRYARPAAPLLVDAVPLVALLVLGVARGSVGAIFGIAFVALFFRAMFGTRRQVVANGVGYFAMHEGVRIATEGVAAVDAVSVGVTLVSFVGAALVMQALGAAAVDHDRVVRRERILTEVSARLLEATSEESVHRAAVEGAVQLAGDPEPSVTLWAGGETMEVVARAGADLWEVDRADLSALPSETRALFQHGRPYRLDAEATGAVEEAVGHPQRFEETIVAPLTHGVEVVGALVLVSTDGLEPALLDAMGRFANEISLARDRAHLLTDLEDANADLRRADTAKDEFLSMVSHELRTPLTSIRGFATTLRDHWEDVPADERIRYLDIINRQSHAQQRLVEDLLTTSAVLADSPSTDPTEVAVAAAIDDAVELTTLDPGELTVTCPVGLESLVDPRHLDQILTNLLSNAAKYGRAPYEIDVGRDGDDVVLLVCDHGEGVPAGFRPQMFEAFEQAETGDNRSSRGVGLGLAIAHSLVTANDGSIAYRTDGPTPGACFEVRLPAAPRAHADRHIDAPAERDHADTTTRADHHPSPPPVSMQHT